MTTITETQVRLIASSQNWVEGEAVRQLYATADRDGMRLAVGFPDLHPGKGSPVGAAFVTEGVIYPHIIGNDIGCAMGLWKTDLSRHKLKLDRWAEAQFDLELEWEGDVHARLAQERLEPTAYDRAFGTLGAGNHFAELQVVEKVFGAKAFAELDLTRDKLVLLVHSGSRGLGESVLRAHVSEHGADGIEENSATANEYVAAHGHAVRWAKANRQVLAERFVATLGASAEHVLDGCHNSIEQREIDGQTVWLHRKGAAPADQGPMIIPGSRGAFSYLVLPQGDGQESAWSLAHGAGRKYARSESRARTRERFRAPQLTYTPLGGRVVCGNRDLLYEEAPTAYKKIEVVIKDLADAGLISVIATLRPVLTYKTRLSKWLPA